MTDLEIVQEAQKRIEAQIKDFEEINRLIGDLVLRLQNHNSWLVLRLQNHNSWLAHKAFFERHKRLETYAGDLLCEVCEYSEYRASYPCPELVAQARLILGVAND